MWTSPDHQIVLFNKRHPVIECPVANTPSPTLENKIFLNLLKHLPGINLANSCVDCRALSLGARQANSGFLQDIDVLQIVQMGLQLFVSDSSLFPVVHGDS